jgi:siroheme synthase-like protein
VNSYPVFLVGLERRRCVVIGGGAEAERKVQGLLDCAAMVTLIAADPGERLAALAATGRIQWLARDYAEGDLEGAFLVIVTERDAAATPRIVEEAERRRLLINVMDDAPRCSFIAGSVVRRGPLSVAISTSGCAPALAVRLREWLEAEIGPETAEFLEMMAELRESLQRTGLGFDRRRALAYALVDSEIREHLRAGRRDLAEHLRDRLVASVEPA